MKRLQAILLFLGIIGVVTAISLAVFSKYSWETIESRIISLLDSSSVTEFRLDPGESKRITIPSDHWFSFYSPDKGMKLKDGKGRPVTAKRLGDATDGNFIIVNEGSEVGRVTLTLREK